MFCDINFWIGLASGLAVLAVIVIVVIIAAIYKSEKCEKSSKDSLYGAIKDTEKKMESFMCEAQKVESENQRTFLESRLGSLYALFELRTKISEMRDELRERWKDDDTDDEDFDWIPLYCRREMLKIGKQLQELDRKVLK